MKIMYRFDKIWCLHCVEQKERFLSSQHEFEKVGILDDVTYHLTTLDHNYNFPKIFPNIKNSAEFNCTREHFTMIKIALEMGYERILIFENDVKLIRKDYWDMFMNNVPNDFDILRLGGQTDEYLPSVHKFNINQIYWERLTYPIWSTIAYALSTKGMEYYINYIKEFYPVADMPLFDMNRIKNNNLNCYISTIPLAYHYKYDSSIQNNLDLERKEFAEKYYQGLNLSIYE